MSAHLVRLARFTPIFCQSAAPESSASAPADVAQEAGLDTIRYESVHDPAHNANLRLGFDRRAFGADPRIARLLGALISRRNRAINAGNAACR